MRASYLAIVILAVLNFVASVTSEVIDNNEVDRFCYPEQHKNTRRSCDCNYEGMPPWGVPAVSIDCSYKDLKTADLSESLPLYASTLDLSWNALEKLPMFAGDSLRVLNVMHNNISAIVSKNFVKVSNLRELYLGWNSIQFIELKAFDDLAHLKVLDVSHNNLRTLGLQLFRPLLVLEKLSLSWNRQLNQTEGIQELEFYRTFGVNTKLHTLRLEACSLSNLVLSENAPLIELSVRRNLLKRIPEKLPTSLEKIDLSENLLESLHPNDTKLLPSKLSELYIEDMPRLQSVAEDAFVPLQALKKVSFQNSRRLTTFHGYAFGSNSNHRYPALRSIIFRGTSLRSLNSTLAPLFQQLTELDLNGMPLHCDCELVWVKGLHVETNGRCFNPSRLRGKRLSNAEVTDFSCDRFPRWAYGIIIFILIMLSAVLIYWVVMCLRPNRGGVTMRRRVGAGSPYARVTIEPNRRENYY